MEASLDIGTAMISNLLVLLGDEARNPGFGSDVLCKAMVVQIVVHLARFYHGISVEIPVASGLALWRLRLIDDRLRDVQAAPTLFELASLCKLSVRQLSRGFRASRGISIGEHVARERIKHAKRLLETCESVKSVAFTMGFVSSSSFSYAFRKSTGVSPSDFKARS